jgi:hypothetical protein
MAKVMKASIRYGAPVRTRVIVSSDLDCIFVDGILIVLSRCSTWSTRFLPDSFSSKKDELIDKKKRMIGKRLR